MAPVLGNSLILYLLISVNLLHHHPTTLNKTTHWLSLAIVSWLNWKPTCSSSHILHKLSAVLLASTSFSTWTSLGHVSVDELTILWLWTGEELDFVHSCCILTYLLMWRFSISTYLLTSYYYLYYYHYYYYNNNLLNYLLITLIIVVFRRVRWSSTYSPGHRKGNNGNER